MRFLRRFLWRICRPEHTGRLAILNARCNALQNQRDNALQESWRLGREVNYQRETVALVRARLDGEQPQTDNPPAHGPYLVAVAGYRHWLAGYYTATGWRIPARAGIASPVTHWRRMPAMPVDRVPNYIPPTLEECGR
jgi:hypothetical protein